MNMIKKISILALGILSLGFVQAQNIGYVDSDIILAKMPEYKSAQQQLDDLAAKWQAKANEMQTEVDQLWQNFQAEKYFLTPVQQDAKQKIIVDKEYELFKFREDKFGQNGELFRKREELIKPIQDKIYAAVQKVAKKNGLKFMFDKAGGVLMLYADERYDKTEDVLAELGVADAKPKTEPKDD